MFIYVEHTFLLFPKSLTQDFYVLRSIHLYNSLTLLLHSLHLNYFLGHIKPVLLQCLSWADHLYQELYFEHDTFNRFAAEWSLQASWASHSYLSNKKKIFIKSFCCSHLSLLDFFLSLLFMKQIFFLLPLISSLLTLSLFTKLLALILTLSFFGR